MPKYYVESGDLKVVVQAERPIPAAATALSWATEYDRLDRYVTVNERGFRSAESPHRDAESMVVLETGTLYSLIAEHALA